MVFANEKLFEIEICSWIWESKIPKRHFLRAKCTRQEVNTLEISVDIKIEQKSHAYEISWTSLTETTGDQTSDPNSKLVGSDFDL